MSILFSDATGPTLSPTGAGRGGAGPGGPAHASPDKLRLNRSDATVEQGALRPLADSREAVPWRVLAGRQKMRASRVVLCGLARDVERVFDATSQALERLGRLFASYRIVVYENDSADRTPELLHAWSQRNERVTVLSEVLGAPTNPPQRCLQRASRMAFYRNRY